MSPCYLFLFAYMDNMTAYEMPPNWVEKLKRWTFRECTVFSEFIDLLPRLLRSLFVSLFWERGEQIEYCVINVNPACVSLRYRRLTSRQFSKRRAKWRRPEVMTSLRPSSPGGRITARLRMITWSIPRSWRQVQKQCWLSLTKTDTKVWCGHVWNWFSDKFVDISYSTKRFVFHF